MTLPRHKPKRIMLHFLPEQVAGTLGKAIIVATQKGKVNVTTVEKKVIGWQIAGVRGAEKRANDQRATLMAGAGAGRETRTRMQNQQMRLQQALMNMPSWQLTSLL
jgi:hypothetical protein